MRRMVDSSPDGAPSFGATLRRVGWGGNRRSARIRVSAGGVLPSPLAEGLIWTSSDRRRPTRPSCAPNRARRWSRKGRRRSTERWPGKGRSPSRGPAARRRRAERSPAITGDLAGGRARGVPAVGGIRPGGLGAWRDTDGRLVWGVDGHDEALGRSGRPWRRCSSSCPPVVRPRHPHPSRSIASTAMRPGIPSHPPPRAVADDLGLHRCGRSGKV